MTLTLGIDFDGVMYPFSIAFAKWWEQQGFSPTMPEEPTSWHYWRELGLDDERWSLALEAFADDEGYRMEAPYPDALVGVPALFDAGCNLIGVTSRPMSRAVQSSTYGWVGDWLLPLRAVLIGPSAKLEAECDLVVDDDPAVLVALAEMGEAAGVLLDRPWNRNVVGVPRVSWVSLLELVAVVAEGVAGVPVTERPWVVADAVAAFLV